MTHSTTNFTGWIDVQSDSGASTDFGHILYDYFLKKYPEDKIDILMFRYAPECYQVLSGSGPHSNFGQVLNSADRQGFSKVGEFFSYKNLLISPVTDNKDLVKYVLVTEAHSDDVLDRLSNDIKEVNKVYKVVSWQTERDRVAVGLKTANMVSRISHDINSLIALIPKEITKDEALSARINYSEILSREIMYYLRDMVVEKSIVPVEDLLTGIISGIEFPSNVGFTKSYNDNPGSISVDVELMDRAFSAIIDNAITATEIEGGTIEMMVSIYLNNSPFIDHDWLEIKVSDTGPGIANEFLKDVLNPFFTTWKDQGHVGLGLSITEKIIQAHGGHFIIESKPDQGVKSILHLPMR
jgi:signal transduction histidine kinase